MQTFFDNIYYKITDDRKDSICEGGRQNIAATIVSIYKYQGQRMHTILQTKTNQLSLQGNKGNVAHKSSNAIID
jgi:hypothetical protein